MANKKFSTQPFEYMSPRAYERARMGGSLENPLVSPHEEGGLRPSFTNEAQPTEIIDTSILGLTTTADIEDLNTQEGIQRFTETEELLHSAFAPTIRRGENVEALHKRILKMPGTFVESAAETVANIGHNLMSIPASIERNAEEVRFGMVRDSLSEETKQELIGLNNYFGEGIQNALLYSDIDTISETTGMFLSEEAKDALREYQHLLRARQKDKQWLDVKQHFNSFWAEEGMSDHPINIFAQAHVDNSDWRGNEEQLSHKVAQIGGNVAASALLFRGAGLGASGAMSVAARLAPGIMSQAAVVGGATTFGLATGSQYAELRNEALLNGFSWDDASNIGMVGGMIEGGLELAGFKYFKKFLKKDKTFTNILFSSMLPEGVQEAGQTAGENLVAELSGLRDRDFEDIAAEIAISFAGGAFGGFGMSVVQRYAIAPLAGVKTRSWKSELNAEAAQAQEELAVEAAKKTLDKAMEATNVKESTDYVAAYKEQIDLARQTAINNAKEAYYEEAKKVNPNITEQQLDWGWKQVENVLTAEVQTGEVSKVLDNASQNVINYFGKVKATKENNIKYLKEKFSGLDLSDNVKNNLFSGDPFARNEAQWELLGQQISNDIVAVGGTKAEGVVMGKFLKGLFGNATLLNENITPGDIYKAIKPTIISIDRLHLHGIKIEGIQNLLGGIVKKGISFQNLGEAQAKASKVVELLASGEKNVLEQVNTELFGQSDAVTDINALNEAINRRARMEQALFNEMGLTHQDKLSQLDYAAIAIMRMQGASQFLINKAFGLQTAEGVNSNEAYANAVDKVFPEPSDEEQVKLRKLINDMNGREDSSVEVSGVYSPRTNVAIVTDKQSVLHEGTHAITTQAQIAGYEASTKTDIGNRISEAYKLSIYGLLEQKGSVNAVLNRLKEVIAKEGKTLTDTQFQETLNEALFSFLATGETSDPLLTEALNELKADQDMKSKHPKGSLYKNMSAKKKEEVKGVIKNLLEPSAATQMANDAQVLEEQIYSLEGNELKDKIIEFLDNNQIVGKDAFAVQVHLFNDPVRLAALATDIIQSARNTSLELLFKEEYQSSTDENGNVVYRHTPEVNIDSWDTDLLFMAQAKAMKLPKTWGPPNWKTQGKEWLTSSFGAKKWKELFNKATKSFLDAGYDVDESIGATILKADYERLTRNVKLQNKIGEFGNNLNKIQDADYLKFKAIILSGNDKCVQKASEFLTEKGFAKAGTMLLEIHQEIMSLGKELQKLGVEIDLIADYMPSIVSKPEELKKYLYGHDSDSEIAKTLREMKKKGVKREGIINAINGLLLGATKDQQLIAMFNHRTILQRSADLMPFYEDPIVAMSKYVEAATRTIMQRHLFGYIKSETKKDGKTKVTRETEVTGVIGEMITNLQEKGVLKDKNEALEFFKLASQNFTSGNLIDISMLDDLRKLGQATTLGQVTRAPNQFMELATVAARYGMVETFNAFKEVLHKQGVNIDTDLGLSAIDENLKTVSMQDFLSRLTNVAYKYSGFAWSDAINKNIALTAARNSNKKLMNKKDTNSAEYIQLMTDIQRVFPDGLYTSEQQKQAYEDIASGELTENNKLFLAYQLGQTQPIMSSMLPPFYFSGGSLGRFMYSYKTVPIRQLSWLVKWAIDGKRIGGKKEMYRRLGKLAGFSALISIPVGMISSLLKNRDPEPFKDAILAPFQVLMINEFTIDIAKKEGLWSAVKETAVPSINIINDTTKGAYKMFTGEFDLTASRSIPVFGDIVYSLAGPGAGQNKRQKRELVQTFVPEIEIDIFSDEAIERYQNSLDFIRGKK